MSKFNTNIIVDDSGKMKMVYFTGVPVMYASILKPKLKYKTDNEYEFCLTMFVSKETKEKCIDLRLNKSFAEVGVDRKSKGDRKVKYPTATQVEGDAIHYGDYEGMFGINLAADLVTKKGSTRSITLIDSDRNHMTCLVGNGSLCNIKCLAWEGQDGDLNLILNTVQVVELVEYNTTTQESMDAAIFGGTVQKAVAESVEEPATPAKKAVAKKQVVAEVDFDDDIPF